MALVTDSGYLYCIAIRCAKFCTSSILPSGLSGSKGPIKRLANADRGWWDEEKLCGKRVGLRKGGGGVMLGERRDGSIGGKKACLWFWLKADELLRLLLVPDVELWSACYKSYVRYKYYKISGIIPVCFGWCQKQDWSPCLESATAHSWSGEM